MKQITDKFNCKLFQYLNCLFACFSKRTQKTLTRRRKMGKKIGNNSLWKSKKDFTENFRQGHELYSPAHNLLYFNFFFPAVFSWTTINKLFFFHSSRWKWKISKQQMGIDKIYLRKESFFSSFMTKDITTEHENGTRHRQLLVNSNSSFEDREKTQWNWKSSYFHFDCFENMKRKFS